MLNYMLFFVSGILTKISDNVVDRKISKVEYAYIGSFISGLIFSYLFSSSIPFATIIVGVLASVLFAGKVDHRTHQIAFGTFLAGIFVFGWNQINPIFFSLIFIASFADEYINDNLKNQISEYRLFLEVTCIAISLISLDPSYFVGIFSFDVGYIITEMFTR